MNRTNRLRASRDFSRALRDGRRGSFGPVACVVLDRGDGGPARVGLAVTRKAGSAVRRNRAKRLLREAARAVLPQVAPGTDVVLSPRGDLASKSFQEIVAAVEAALTSAGARC